MGTTEPQMRFWTRKSTGLDRSSLDLLAPHLKKQATLLEAAKLMITSRTSEVFVVDEDEEPVGVVREVDVVKSVADGVQAANVTVAEIMLEPPPTIEEGANISQVSSVLAKTEVRRLLVSDGENIIGLVQAGELFDLVSSCGKNMEVFKAVSVRTRLRIAELLSIESMSVADLAEELGMKPITVRHHLDVLRRNGMVEEFQDDIFGKVGRPLSLFRIASSVLKKSKLH